MTDFRLNSQSQLETRRALQQIANESMLSAASAANWTDLTDGGITTLHEHNADDINMPKVGTPTLNTLAEDFTTRGSAGVADGTLTYLSVGSTAVKVSVAAGEGYLRTSADPQAELVFCKWSASADLYTFSAPAAETETEMFFGISYNAGTPIAINSATFSDFNGYDKISLGSAFYDGTNMEILNAYHHAEDTAKFTRQYLREVFPFMREEAPEGTGGLELSTSGTNQMSMTAGHIWHGFNQYMINAIAAGAQFATHYKTAAGFVTGTATAWNATDYSTGAALAAMTVNRYGVRWIYIDVGKNSVVGSAYNAQLDMVYGTSNAVSVAAAQQELAPSVPTHLGYQGRLIGRIIFQKSATSATLVESAWTNMFAASAVGDHSLLSNLQGGAASDYYHLTSAQVTKLDGIETAADVTDAANVDAAGAVMNSDTSTAAMSFVIDEDTMVSNSATKVPTQQSVKAYVDAASGGGFKEALLARSMIV
jgi:hypothetical protein